MWVWQESYAFAGAERVLTRAIDKTVLASLGPRSVRSEQNIYMSQFGAPATQDDGLSSERAQDHSIFPRDINTPELEQRGLALGSSGRGCEWVFHSS
jgi:hypothetical protein